MAGNAELVPTLSFHSLQQRDLRPKPAVQREENAMATLEDIATVRLLTADSDEVTDPLLSDEQIIALLTLNGDQPRLAAADALEAIAASEVLVSKKIRTQDLSTDGPAVSAELRALAKQLRDRHAELVDADDDGFFDVVDTVSCRRPPELTEYEVWGL